MFLWCELETAVPDVGRTDDEERRLDLVIHDLSEMNQWNNISCGWRESRMKN